MVETHPTTTTINKQTYTATNTTSLSKKSTTQQQAHLFKNKYYTNRCSKEMAIETQLRRFWMMGIQVYSIYMKLTPKTIYFIYKL
jgi:hypothetical protein